MPSSPFAVASMACTSGSLTHSSSLTHSHNHNQGHSPALPSWGGDLSQRASHYQPRYLMSTSQAQNAPPSTDDRDARAPVVPTKAKMNQALSMSMSDGESTNEGHGLDVPERTLALGGSPSPKGDGAVMAHWDCESGNTRLLGTAYKKLVTLHRNPPNSEAKMMSGIPTCLLGSAFHAPGVIPFKIRPSQQNRMLIMPSAVVIAERSRAGAETVILGYWNTRGRAGVHVLPDLIEEIETALSTVRQVVGTSSSQRLDSTAIQTGVLGLPTVPILTVEGRRRVECPKPAFFP
ncbi:hypothetical protein C8R44DRAFT_945220 [Mycena epipterygia]|nr:hypothetical protein C8R44DRAFT_945220 [Mycena epipterygia]